MIDLHVQAEYDYNLLDIELRDALIRFLLVLMCGVMTLIRNM